MRRPHMRSLAVAVTVTTAATLPAVPALAGTAAPGFSPAAAARAAAFTHSSATGVTRGTL
ncbi:hypothetical protein ACWGQ5_29480 [Streptomyces sp. NPDC055722]